MTAAPKRRRSAAKEATASTPAAEPQQPHAQPAEAGQPRVAVVIPVMGHPVLVDDAIASAAALMDEGSVCRIIVVNDGCRYAETRASLDGWAALLGPQRFTVVPQRNSGLSAARNAGIELALADPAGPPDAVFMLDADNRLAPGAGRAFAQLLREQPEADWFYPPFDFFGQEGYYAGEAAPSALMHMLANHSEAGSLIRTRVFASGLRFAEDLRQGYEDWDFFLSAAGRGFTGAPAGRPMLHYRKRPSSMLAESHELDLRLRAELRSRHGWLFSTRSVLTREAAAFPRYALLSDPDHAAQVGTDPDRMQEWPAGQLEAVIFRHLADPIHHHAPPLVILMAEPLRRRLSEAGLLRGILWNIERRMARDPRCKALAVSLETEQDAFGWREEAGADTLPVIFAMGPQMIEQAARRSGLAADTGTLRREAARATLTIPSDMAADVPGADGPALEVLRRLFASDFHEALGLAWDWREPGGARSRADAITAPRLVASGGVLLPLLGTPGARLEIGFTLPIFDQGGVEKVVLQLTRVLREAGHACHLFIIGGRPAYLPPGDRALFASVSFFPDRSASDWHGREYFGTAESSWGNPQERADLEGLLRPMDLVIDAHAAAVHKVATALRRGGTRMADHEHLLEISQYGRAYGPPLLALAYENAYDRFLTCSAKLADWLAAHGVPRDKLMPLVNAPGYPLTGEATAAAVAGRADPQSDRPLNVLYLGRLDEQKGIDRVAAIFGRLAAAAQQAGGPRFRLVVGGRAVVGGAQAVQWPSGTRILGPVEGSAALTRAFAEADILVLPSRYEGLPLVLLEAQRVGCVPVATDVGAVREAIDDGRTGFVVPEDGAVDAMTDRILALAADRALLASVSRAASANSRTWEETAAPLLDWCQTIWQQREAAAAGSGV